MILYKKINIQKALLFTGLFLFILNILSAVYMPLIDDEAYYWMWSQSIDFGYFDHPPLIALWINLGFDFFHNEFGVRLLSVFFSTVGFLLLAKFLKVKTEKEYVIFVLLWLSCSLFQVFSFVSTPDTPLFFFCIVYLFALQRFLNHVNIFNSIALSLAMVLLMYSKYHSILIIAFSLLPSLKRCYKKRNFYIVLILTLILYSPHIIWQYNHDFVSLNYHLFERNNYKEYKWNFTVDYVLSWIVGGWFLGSLYVIKSLIKQKVKTDFERSLLSVIVGVFAFFFISSFKTYVQIQWILIALVPLFIMTYKYLNAHNKVYKSFIILSSITASALLFVRLYCMFPNVPYKTSFQDWENFMLEAKNVTQGTAVFEKYQLTSLYNFYNYPYSSAENYITIENRKSQYDLWNSEQSLNNKNITYFSPYIHSNDSINTNNRRNESFKYKYIQQFQTTKDLKIKVSVDSISNNTMYLNLIVQNESNQAFDSNQGNFQLQMVITEQKYSDTFKCIQTIPYSSFVIDGHDETKFTTKVELCKLSNKNYFAYLGFVNQNLPVKIQSNHIELKLL